VTQKSGSCQAGEILTLIFPAADGQDKKIYAAAA
jgi:hypothetical protein